MEAVKSIEPSLYTDKRFALSQTALKDWRAMPPNLWYENWVLGRRKFKRKRVMDFGQLLDTLCFNPELFDKRFIVAECAKPSEKVENILVDVYEHLSELNHNIKDLNQKNGTKVPYKKMSLENNEDVVKKFCLQHKHYENKPDQAFGDVLKKGGGYWEFLKKIGKRVSITEQQKKSARELKEILYTNPNTKGFFVPKKGCEVLFQVQLHADFPIGAENVESIPIKGILDIVHFNHNKKIVREVDLKFTNDVFNFNGYGGPVKMFGYTEQHSFYNYLIREWLQTYKDGAYADYVVQPPINVTIDDVIKVPYVYRYNMDDLIIKQKGVEGSPIRGWEDVLRDISWHIEKNDFSRPREHIENGFIQINSYKK